MSIDVAAGIREQLIGPGGQFEVVVENIDGGIGDMRRLQNDIFERGNLTESADAGIIKTAETIIACHRIQAANRMFCGR